MIVDFREDCEIICLNYSQYKIFEYLFFEEITLFAHNNLYFFLFLFKNNFLLTFYQI